MKISVRAIAARMLACIVAFGCIPAAAAATNAQHPRRLASRPAATAVLAAATSTKADTVSLATASLESVATKASETGRNIAMSLIGLALAVASIVLAFKRDFKEAAAVFVVGLVCVLLATSAGESLLQDTVKALVG